MEPEDRTRRWEGMANEGPCAGDAQPSGVSWGTFVCRRANSLASTRSASDFAKRMPFNEPRFAAGRGRKVNESRDFSTRSIAEVRPLSFTQFAAHAVVMRCRAASHRQSVPVPGRWTPPSQRSIRARRLCPVARRVPLDRHLPASLFRGLASSSGGDVTDSPSCVQGYGSRQSTVDCRQSAVVGPSRLSTELPTED